MSKHKIKICDELALPLDFIVATDGIFASKGMGKTHLAQVMAEEMLRLGQVIVAIDPTDAWWGLLSSADGKHDGYPITVIGGEHGHIALEPDAGKSLAEAIVAERFSCVICTDGLSDTQELVFVRTFLDALYRKNRKPLHVFVDEADIFAPQKPFEVEDSRCIRAMSHIVRRGRKKGIGSTVITQRPSELNASVRSQVEMLFVLGMLNNLDIDAVEKWMRLRKKKRGPNASFELQEQMIESLDTLQLGDAWAWAPRLKIHQRFRARDKETFDSGATPKPGKKRREAKRLAPVDVARLGATMAEAAQRQRDNDPKALRAKLAAAEKELARVNAQPSKDKKVTTVDHVIEKPAVSRAMVVSLERGLARIEKAAPKFDSATERAAAMFGEAIAAATAAQAKLEGELAQLRIAIQALTGRRVEKVIEYVSSKPVASKRLTSKAIGAQNHPPMGSGRLKLEPRTPAPRDTSAERDGRLPPGELKILTAIVQFGTVQRDQLSVLCGYKASARNTYISRLVGRGFIVNANGSLEATADGMNAVRDVERLPTGDALRVYWYKTLPAGEGKILEQLIEAYPELVPREQICEGIYKPSARNTYISRLTSRRLVIATRDGVVASPSLFD